MGRFAKGFGAVKKAKAASEENQKAFEAMRAREMILINSGDEAVIWFNGSSQEEPVQVPHHDSNIGGRFRAVVCAKGQEGHEGCVDCYVSRPGKKQDKRVSKAANRSCFNVADSRWIHKTKNEAETKKAGFDRFDWADCPDDGTCRLCKRKVPRERGGQKILKAKTTMATSIDVLNDTLHKKCLCGGRIKLLGYKKGKKLLPDLDDVDDPTEWEAKYACSKCQDPTPGSIFLCPITMRRSGKGKGTTYTFIEGPFEDPPAWVQKLEPVDLENMMAPSADKQAEKLGIDNPFAGGGGKKGKQSESYDDDEEEDDPFEEEEDEDEEEEETPKKKASSTKKKKAVKDEDDEEDEEADDDEDEEE